MAEDVTYALVMVVKTAGRIGVPKSDVENTTELCNRYGDDRDRLFEGMLSLLDRSDTSDLRDRWADLNETGTSLLERLDREVPGTSEGEGLAGLGAKDFADGEKKIWEENAKANIAFVAEVISKIYQADIELIKQCNNELKKVRDDDAVLQLLIDRLDKSLVDRALDLLTKLPKAGAAAFNLFLGDPSAKAVVTGWGNITSDLMADLYKQAEDRAALSKTIKDKIELIQKTEEKLSEEWVEEMFKKGEEFATSLRDSGRHDEYEARDWDKFGQECLERLAQSRDRAREQSRQIFDELLPTFKAEIMRRFSSLTDDPAKIEQVQAQMDDCFQSMKDVLGSLDVYINSLEEGPFVQAARETFDLLEGTINETQTKWRDRIDAIIDLFKR